MDNTTRFIIAATYVVTFVMFLVLGVLASEINTTNKFERAALTLCNRSPYPVECMSQWSIIKEEYGVE